MTALLDDRDATPDHPASRLYTGFVREHRSIDPATLEAVWAAVEADQRQGLHALLLADYEWGAKLLQAGHTRLAADDRSSLRVLMYDRCERLSRDQADAWLASREAELGGPPAQPGPAGVIGLRESVDEAEFSTAIHRIHEAIRAGETYQINYTYRLDGQAHGLPVALFRRLRARQPVSYGAYIELPPAPPEDAVDGRPAPTHILSCSPELFLRHEAGRLTAKPMKGTASRILAPEGDSETARLLSLDVKNRAENLMIVDLLRNDIGRISTIGSVRVPALFSIEPYATVFQMTSTVQSELRRDVDMPALLRAVFPCGSITGAPKHYTMKLIEGLESTPRGLYTGAIGWIDAAPPAGPDGDAPRRIGDFCLSVAIRTLTLGPAETAGPTAGTRPARLGIGAGIVLDSVAADEFAECRLKARFLTGLDPGFALFETMLATPDGGVRHLDRHLARLARSAAALGFRYDAAAARALLDRRLSAAMASAATATSSTTITGGPLRLRLSLTHDGQLELTQAPLATLSAPDGPVTLRLEPVPLPPASPLAAHKTTLRAHYDAGIRAAEQQGAFDSLFFGADDQLVEGGRSNVFVKLQGRWVTPPVADGALPGVMRSVLLDDPAWAAVEGRVPRAALATAEAIVVCNALRGVLPARLAG